MNPFKTRFFKHYKNKPYKYIGIARHSETQEELALYETLYKNDSGRIWVRPKDMFFENVVIEGKSQPRFRPVPFEIRQVKTLAEIPIDQLTKIYEQCFGTRFDQNKYIQRLTEKSDFLFLIAYEDQNAVGFKAGYRIGVDRFYSWQGAVLPDFRELGVASELMRRQHALLKERNYKFVETHTMNQFPAMISLNLTQGFQITGTKPDEKGLKIIMEKVLS